MLLKGGEATGRRERLEPLARGEWNTSTRMETMADFFASPEHLLLLPQALLELGLAGHAS